MQYGETVPKGKSNSSLEAVSFLWINVSGYNFNIINIHYMNLQPSQPNIGKNLQYLSNINFKTAC